MELHAPTVVYNGMYERYLEMVWTNLDCFIFSLNTKQMLAQNTLFLDCTSLPSLWELLDGFTEPFLMDAKQPPVQSHCLCRRSAPS